jgi:hypothetical protein
VHAQVLPRPRWKRPPACCQLLGPCGTTNHSWSPSTQTAYVQLAPLSCQEPAHGMGCDPLVQVKCQKQGGKPRLQATCDHLTLAEQVWLQAGALSDTPLHDQMAGGNCCMLWFRLVVAPTHVPGGQPACMLASWLQSSATPWCHHILWPCGGCNALSSGTYVCLGGLHASRRAARAMAGVLNG